MVSTRLKSSAECGAGSTNLGQPRPILGTRVGGPSSIRSTMGAQGSKCSGLCHHWGFCARREHSKMTSRRLAFAVAGAGKQVRGPPQTRAVRLQGLSAVRQRSAPSGARMRMRRGRTRRRMSLHTLMGPPTSHTQRGRGRGGEERSGPRNREALHEGWLRPTRAECIARPQSISKWAPLVVTSGERWSARAKLLPHAERLIAPRTTPLPTMSRRRVVQRRLCGRARPPVHPLS